MHFKKSFALSVLIVAVLGLWVALNVTSQSASDQELWRKLTDHSAEGINQYSVKQERHGATKTLLLGTGDERKIGMIKSETSELVFNHENQQQEILEEMYGVEMMYQEELLMSDLGMPIQVVVALQAEHAIYYYQQQKWVGENVLIQRYQLPGHEFPQKIDAVPFFQGTADQIAFDMSQALPTLHTYGLNATFVKDSV